MDQQDSEDRSVDKDGRNESSDDVPRSSGAHWTKEEDLELKRAVTKYEAKNWKKIAEKLNGRTDV